MGQRHVLRVRAIKVTGLDPGSAFQASFGMITRGKRSSSAAVRGLCCSGSLTLGNGAGLVGLGAAIALGADGFVVLLSPSRQARPIIALRLKLIPKASPNSALSIAAVWLAENLTHNSCILSTTIGFQCDDALPLMAWAWAGKRCSRKLHLGQF